MTGRGVEYDSTARRRVSQARSALFRYLSHRSRDLRQWGQPPSVGIDARRAPAREPNFLSACLYDIYLQPQHLTQLNRDGLLTRALDRETLASVER